MTYLASHDLWGPGRNHVAAPPPSPGDLFVVTTLLGKQVRLQPVTEYEGAVRLAQAFARRVVYPEPVTDKAFCLTLT